MKILFCNIAWMKYYKGIIPGKDEPYGGGSYVVENGDGEEVYNFFPVANPNTDDDSWSGDYCLGFVETKQTKGKSNQLSIEKIDGCQGATGLNSADDVLVIYCARYPFSEKRETCVVGWYNHATVYRDYQYQRFFDKNDIEVDGQDFNAIAKKEDCVLLPPGVRRKGTTWVVPRTNDNGAKFGFGQSNVWFANDQKNEALQIFLKRISEQIKNYDGENWIDYDGTAK